MSEPLGNIPEISRWIRDYGHDPRHMQRLLSVRFDWHQLWTALDIIDDVEFAIRSYLEHDFPSEPGEQYLRIYGIFQALFVQQDALRHFIEVIRPGMAVTLTDVLKDVREARNASVGHPTELLRKGEVSAHGISRISMSKEGFDLISFSEQDGISIRHVPVKELIAKQRNEAARVLSEVVTELKSDDEKHRSMFRGKSLKNAFHLVLYAFEKISEELHGNRAIGLAQWGTDQLRVSLDEFEQMLNDRGLNVETYDSIKYLYGKISYPLAELGKFFERKPSDIPSAEAAIVYADALQSSFSELMDIAEEIDEEYATVAEV